MFIKNAVSPKWGAGGKMDASIFYALGVVLVVVGIITIVTVIIVASMRGAGKRHGRIKGAGVIMIGPVPIIFGTDKKSVKSILALSLALSITVVIALVVYYLLSR